MNPDYLIYCKESKEKGIGVKYSIPGRTPYRKERNKRTGKIKMVRKKRPIYACTKIHPIEYEPGHLFEYKKNSTRKEIGELIEYCELNDTYYVLHDINRRTIGRLKVGSLVNSVNHSSTPNCEFKGDWLVAKKQIEHGEFLSVSYGNTEFGREIRILEGKEKDKQKKIKQITKQVKKEAKENGGYIRKKNGRFGCYKDEINKRLK